MMTNKSNHSPMFFQTGTFSSLTQAVYEGDMTISDLAKHGDFGLGTFNGVDGEMVSFDGKFYRIDAAGVASEIPAETKTPFAVVTHFQAQQSFSLDNIHGFENVGKAIDAHLPATNYFYAIRLNGEFAKIKSRSELCQPKPYRPLVETMPKLQRLFNLENTTGTLVATRFPAYMTGLNVSGYHYHYLNQEKTTGGHVFDISIKHAKVAVCQIKHHTMALIDNPLFAKANLDQFNVEHEEIVEKISSPIEIQRTEDRIK